MPQKKDSFTLVGVGDVSPNRDDPPSIFRHCGDVFRTADIVFGQMESPLSDRGTPNFVPHSPCRLRAKNISALTEEGAGFDVMSFACNHAMDYGWDAFYDTLDALKKNNIPVIGAGKNIQEARKPAILERKGTKVGFLAYISIICPGLVAEADIPGCVPLRATTYYQQLDFQPGSPPRIVTKLWPEDKAAMEEDIKKLRPQVDVLVVFIHCGLHFKPAVIPMYQKEASYAAVDAGADLVLQCHAHILKGIEVYKGKSIFYGLANFALEHGLAFPGKLAKGFDQLYTTAHTELYHDYPRDTDARKTIIAKAVIQDKKIQKVSYIPVLINANREPEVLTRKSPRAQEVVDYVQQISDSQGLKVQLAWDGDEVLVSETK
ncbi:MAG: capA 3 [Dehalococcoidales bacterium]|nr:capA 3 [Dehalococcoidales bacterium]